MARQRVDKIPDQALAKIAGAAQYRMAQHAAEILIGRAEQALPSAVVLPEVHSQKWGGECWLKISHADVNHVRQQDTAKDFVNAKGGAGVEIPVSATGRKHKISEGSVEWDIEYATSAALPADYEVFTAEFPAGLTWHKQLELTVEEIAAGCDRPEDIINSYALYWDQSGRYLNAAGEELVNYETGKFCHIKRPKWIDAEENVYWGDQDFIDGELRCYLPPQEWLDAAVWPVTLDPVLGYETTGASSVASTANYLFSTGPFSPAVSGTLDAITFISSLTGGDNFVLGLYDNDSSYPGTLIDYTGELTGTNNNATAVGEGGSAQVGVSVSSAASYWLAALLGGAMNIYYDSGGVRFRNSAYTYSSALPSTFPGGYSSAAYYYSIYATYTESAGGLSLTLDTSWRIETITEKQLAWRIQSAAVKTTGWRIHNATSPLETAWRIFAESVKDSAWTIRATAAADTAWRILTVADKETGWRVLGGIDRATAWRILNATNVETAWQILTGGFLTLNTAWRIEGTATKETAYRIQAGVENDLAWRIAEAASKETAWRIQHTITNDTAWRVQNSVEQDTAWRVLTVTGQDVAWRIQAELEKDTAWRILTAEELATAWDIDSEDIPAPIKTFLATNRTTLFTADNRRLAFNATNRTLIFLAD
ncbi:hypothetical protein HTZ97_16560 [Desulfuromonas acetoxidans]|uniref:Uncharacterized protein n=1 Tax=Desulfuromonas acetoxidans (strain DSM 684 / 11070) TaxID=281689 RepID=Q1K083_DESA6|nr:hypothetical protein [Desulfuromonas acetoxidans]EAT16058.1 hypothetical protein Dace_2359 [Desulfuromonas acetoxidans DSM 684]MBF0647081.1 hypothetical protein [Desulfuromonas acetoxidans]NVD26206.1 hypothetical protein [Desulfuromonas acetoxidans]NVE18070.1 hypothetical protein [Desulfuromonas acetoxidans]